MADPKKPIEVRQKWEKVLAEQWAAPMEKIAWVHIGQQAYAASVINGRPRVPHTPLDEVPETTLEVPEWPLPSEAVATGRFMGDEWADDPSIAWWATANHPEQDSVRLADHFAAGYDHIALVASNLRLALVIEDKDLAEKKNESDTEGKGWFGKARQAVAQAQSAADDLSSRFSNRGNIVSFHEVDARRISQVQALQLGRSIPRQGFLRIDFTDGSYLLTRSNYASLRASDFNTALGLNQQGNS